MSASTIPLLLLLSALVTLATAAPQFMFPGFGGQQQQQQQQQQSGGDDDDSGSQQQQQQQSNSGGYGAYGFPTLGNGFYNGYGNPPAIGLSGLTSSFASGMQQHQQQLGNFFG